MSKKPKLAAKPTTPVTHIGTQIQVSFIKPSADGSSAQQGSIASQIVELTKDEWDKAFTEIQAHLAKASAMTREEFAEAIKPKQ
jgi:hypothetical protein